MLEEVLRAARDLLFIWAITCGALAAFVGLAFVSVVIGCGQWRSSPKSPRQ